MALYRVLIEGIITKSDTSTHPVTLNRQFEADSHTEAKVIFKEYVAQRVSDRNGVSFEGTVSAWIITETQLLDESPFKVGISLTQTVEVDF